MDFFKRLSEEMNINLNEQQKKAVKHQEGPALILAGPGSGKTTVIISRLAYLLLEKGIQPERILSMTFNKAAALEMESRFLRVFGNTSGVKIRFSTLHSFAYSVLREYERKRSIRFTLIEEQESAVNKRSILKTIFKEVNSTIINDDEMEALINELGYAKNKMLKDLKEHPFSTRGFEQIYAEYEQYKRKNRMIDFDDMLTHAYGILKKETDILERYRSKYQYLQIDEGQDLSKIQFEIVKLLALPKNNLFMVADDDQSIYGFRGAEPEYILNFRKDFPGAVFYYLENNYRSTKNIVEISSKLIKRNTRRYDKNHTTVNDYKKEPEIIEVQDETGQAEYLLKVAKKHTEGRKPGKDMAVLFRNNLSAVLLTEALDRNGISFHLREGTPLFFKHWFVLDILAFIKFSINPKDAEALERIYYKMNRYLSKSMVEYARSMDGDKTLLEKMVSYEELKPFQRKTIFELREEFARLAKMSPGKALKYIEREFKYLDNAKDYCEKTGYSYKYVQDLFTILEAIAGRYQNLIGFLGRISELETLMKGSVGKRRESHVVLSTVHSSKGLEFDRVYLIDLFDGEFPGHKSLEASEKEDDNVLLEEERRLFYVGITRAREQVALVCPKTRNGQPVPKSLFIREVMECIGSKLLNELGEGSIIRHKKFGKGIVMEILEGSDDKTMIRADFGGISRILDFKFCIEKKVLEI